MHSSKQTVSEVWAEVRLSVLHGSNCQNTAAAADAHCVFADMIVTAAPASIVVRPLLCHVLRAGT